MSIHEHAQANSISPGSWSTQSLVHRSLLQIFGVTGVTPVGPIRFTIFASKTLGWDADPIVQLKNKNNDRPIY